MVTILKTDPIIDEVCEKIKLLNELFKKEDLMPTIYIHSPESGNHEIRDYMTNKLCNIGMNVKNMVADNYRNTSWEYGYLDINIATYQPTGMVPDYVTLLSGNGYCIDDYLNTKEYRSKFIDMNIDQTLTDYLPATLLLNYYNIDYSGKRVVLIGYKNYDYAIGEHELGIIRYDQDWIRVACDNFSSAELLTGIEEADIVISGLYGGIEQYGVNYNDIDNGKVIINMNKNIYDNHSFSDENNISTDKDVITNDGYYDVLWQFLHILRIMKIFYKYRIQK